MADDPHGDSDSSGNVPVVVVVDMTEAGKKIAHPTPDKPAYYLPLPLGYKEMGGVVKFYQEKPPSTDEVMELLTKAMAEQGYRIMDKQSPPSLVLTFWWGYMAKIVMSGTVVNQDQLLALVAGDTIDKSGRALANDKFINPRLQEVIDWASSSQVGPTGLDDRPRWYMLVTAYDFGSWLKNFKETKAGGPVVDQPIQLWKAHISADLWGHYFSQVLPALVSTGVPMFGRQTTEPQMVTTPLVPVGRVILGTPQVKEFSASPAVDKQP